jgi:hypothetical protein
MKLGVYSDPFVFNGLVTKNIVFSLTTFSSTR